MSPLDDEVTIDDVERGSDRYEAVLSLATRVLDQRSGVDDTFPHALSSHVVGAFRGGIAVGFLRVLIQVIGAEEGRPPVLRGGEPLTEAYVEALGVEPALRRQGIGAALQQRAADLARLAGCYQLRSRSPVTSVENYALKVAAGFGVTPSEKNDSYYFIRTL